VNACEQSLANTPKRPSETALPGAVSPPPELPAEALGQASAQGSRADRWLLARMLSSLGSPPLELAIRGGPRVAAGNPIARVTFESRSTLLWILADVPMRFGDSYSDGRVTVEGDLVTLLESVYCAGRRAGGERESLARRAAQALYRPHGNSLSGSRDNIHHHYDIGNAFYELWLGSTMAYTCAYYPEPTATLDEAQVAKMDHVCRKLRLKPGESVVEAGCGWGMLAMHMARHYGVKVRAFNISHEQIHWARERAAREGLADRVEYVEDDYRNITGRYDAFMSVGMLEHVGVKNYPTLGSIVQRCLGGRGRGLIHSIGRNYPASLNPWIEKRIFPGAHPPALSEMGRIFEPWDLSILDVENLRLHYAQTLRHWLGLFEGASERVRTMFDEKFVRMWRLYLAGSLAAFSTGSLQLFQVVFAPGESNDIPWTRAHLYAR
jgi:cyclopropane-fatty-acyl-phospholipid synthase